MLFNSYEFILVAFPLSLLVYYLLQKKEKNNLAQGWLILFSLFFYGYFNWSYLFIICGSILFNFCCAKLILRCQRMRKIFTILGVVCNVALIFVYKYYDFFIDNVNSVFHCSYKMLNLLLPLGISFFTFQQISYLVDTYRNKTSGDSFLEYALFVSFFPQLIAGPIVTREEMIPQFHEEERRHFSTEYFARGLYFFSIGLAKKVLLADTLAKSVDWGYNNIPSLNGFSAIIVSLLYTFQLYFDFSGYCDMARGIANCFHIDLPQNFNSPYKATSISDFWKRWHMSLSRFLTNYIYIPLGGSRKGQARTLINIMLVFLISGIWHGAGWTFICWGLLHGTMSVIHRLIGKWWKEIPKGLSTFMTFAFCNLAWVFFRADTISDALSLVRKMVTFTRNYFTIPYNLAQSILTTEGTFLHNHIGILQRTFQIIPGIYVYIMILLSASIVFILPNAWEKKNHFSVWSSIGCSILLIWCIYSLSGVSVFLYFNF